MINQHMYNQDLSETQEFQQQMMLCPVRVVYDTQMFLQPGEQVQQSQYVINPQNPPPWIQNQVQNQVIYVQNVPNNYIPYQQHIDQNQFNYGYNVPQMLVQSSQDPRTIQMVPAVVPNPNANQRIITPNIGQISQIPNQVVVNEVQTVQTPNVQEIYTNHVNNEIKQNVTQMQYQEPRLQMPVPIMANIRPEQNVQIRQVQPQVNLQQNYQMQKPITKPAYQIVTNPQPIYRPIQPRSNLNNSQYVQTNQNVVYMNNVNNIRKNTNPIINNQNSISLPNYVKIDSSRKRKSESPDEIHKKIMVPNQIKQEPKPNIVEIVPNTVPRSDNKIIINSMQITPVDTQNSKIKEELAKPVKNISFLEPKQMIRKKMINNVEAIQNLNTVQDKLVRNTVFMQARGRVLAETEVKTEVETKLNPNENLEKTEVKTSEAKIQTDIFKAPIDVSKMIESRIQTNVVKTPTDVPKIVEHRLQTDVKTVDCRIQTDVVKTIEPKQTDFKPIEPKTQTDVNETKPKIQEQLVEKVEKSNKTIQEGDLKNVLPKELKSESEMKDDKCFLLTHVLDGYVIQESNVAFPIRRPLKEKTLHLNTEAIEPKREEKEEKVENEGESERLLDISQLQLKETESEEADPTPKDQDNPFKNIKLTDLKSWTVNHLVSHLKNYGWDETISLLQDHEIDGESLFLVSKNQLVKIGICEEHASVICDFIKS